MNKRFRLAVCILGSAVVAACGGGSGGGDEVAGDPPATPQPSVVDKYVGVWQGCIPWGPNNSDLETNILSRRSETSLDYQYKALRYDNTTCSGTGTPEPEEAGVVQFDGSTVVIDSIVMDKITFQPSNPSEEPIKQVVGISQTGTLERGYGDSRGPDGYPTAIIFPGLLVKQ